MLRNDRAPLNRLAYLLTDEVRPLLILFFMEGLNVQLMHRLIVQEVMERFFGLANLVWDYRFVVNTVMSVRFVDGRLERKLADKIRRAHRALSDGW